jgi:hypothetical protein
MVAAATAPIAPAFDVPFAADRRSERFQLSATGAEYFRI